ncbi:Nibrin [Formica fusca]
MWYLKGHEGFFVYILPNQKKSFGKSQSDIKLEGDATVSELHAVISVESTKESDAHKCVISNISKYGTVVVRDEEKKKLYANDKFILRSGDIVQFGQKYTFVALCHLFVIVRSGLNEEDTERLRNITDYLGGVLSETWDTSCTHLTVAESVLFTTKLACALASAKPIVTIMYWEAVNIAIKESKELPKIEDFLPRVKEEWLKVCSRSFLPNEKRKTLFKGLSFVHFCAKQYFTYAQLIIAAGGKSCVYPTKRPLSPRDLTARNAIVIQQPANDSSQLTQVIAVDYPIIYSKLQAIKRRMISDTEIPLAILYCTTTMYCNPKFDFATFVKLKTQIFPPSDMIITEDTQDVDNAAKRQIERNIIPETCDSQNNQNISKETYFSNKGEQRDTYNASKSNMMKDKQNVNNRENKRKIIPETCDSQNNEHSLKKTRFSDENEQSNFTISKDDIGMKIQNNENNIKNICFFNKNQQNNICNNNENNIVNNIFHNSIVSRKVDKKPQIIPESCNSLEESVNNIFSGKSNNKQAEIIFDTGKPNEKNILSNLAMEKEENVELQEKEVFVENNSILAKNYKKKDILEENKYEFQQLGNVFTNKDNSSIFKNNNLNRKENLIVENDSLNDINDKLESARWKSSKNSEYPRIVSIEEVSNNEMYIQQGKEKRILGKNCFTIEESQKSLIEQKLGSVCKSDRNQEYKTVKENEIQKKDNRKEEPKKTGATWYERYVNHEFTNEILRKDIPCGKKFTKKPITIPEKILKADDFVL